MLEGLLVMFIYLKFYMIMAIKSGINHSLQKHYIMRFLYYM